MHISAQSLTLRANEAVAGPILWIYHFTYPESVVMRLSLSLISGYLIASLQNSKIGFQK